MRWDCYDDDYGYIKGTNFMFIIVLVGWSDKDWKLMNIFFFFFFFWRNKLIVIEVDNHKNFNERPRPDTQQKKNSGKDS